MERRMTTLLLIIAGSAVLVWALPWIVEAIFGRGRGVWFGVAEFFVVAALIPYWFYEWNSQCATSAVEVVGNTSNDNDAVCRALFFGAPFWFLFVSICLLFLVPSVVTLFLETRRRSKPVQRA
jgi:hypothetical protein